jgi:hypothetical protein
MLQYVQRSHVGPSRVKSLNPLMMCYRQTLCTWIISPGFWTVYLQLESLESWRQCDGRSCVSRHAYGQHSCSCLPSETGALVRDGSLRVWSIAQSCICSVVGLLQLILACHGASSSGPTHNVKLRHFSKTEVFISSYRQYVQHIFPSTNCLCQEFLATPCMLNMSSTTALLGTMYQIRSWLHKHWMNITVVAGAELAVSVRLRLHAIEM